MTSKWLVFTEIPQPEGKRTRRWRVTAKRGGDLLGWIGWYAPWRQYAFSPEYNIVLAGSCFTDLAAFIAEQMAVRRVG